MRRRALAALLAAGVAFIAPPLFAQQAPPPRVGLLSSGHVPREHGAFIDAMRQLGYADGRNVTYIQRTSAADTARQVARELVDLKPDVIVTSAPLNVRALEEATSTIPIVFAVIGDAVENGFVANLA